MSFSTDLLSPSLQGNSGSLALLHSGVLHDSGVSGESGLSEVSTVGGEAGVDQSLAASLELPGGEVGLLQRHLVGVFLVLEGEQDAVAFVVDNVDGLHVGQARVGGVVQVGHVAGLRREDNGTTSSGVTSLHEESVVLLNKLPKEGVRVVSHDGNYHHIKEKDEHAQLVETKCSEKDRKAVRKGLKNQSPEKENQGQDKKGRFSTRSYDKKHTHPPFSGRQRVRLQISCFLSVPYCLLLEKSSFFMRLCLLATVLKTHKATLLASSPPHKRV